MTEEAGAGRGRLAQVLATRGGQAAPEAPFVIEHREALIYMLCEAAEVEHTIMCQYLYAAFSLKQAGDEGLTDAELATVDRWRQTVTHIATQEMLHLALVQNLLSAVGAAPHFTRPNLPQPAGHYPPGVVFTLVPFGERSLRHFMFLERPEGMDLHDAKGFAAAERAAAIMQEGEIVPRLQDFATVGHLYRSIESGIRQLCDKYGEEWLFVGPPGAQATPEQFGWPELVVVTDAASAQLAMDTILKQGEGVRGEWQVAHFGQFVDVLDEYLQLKQANPEFEPARPVLPATVRPTEGDAAMPLIADPLTASCTDLFNVCYEVLLQALERYFAHTDETSAELGTLADLAVGLMSTALRPLGQLITTLPVGPDHPGSTAGPSFELFYESDYLLPHRDAAWALIEERLREAAAFAERLRDGTQGPVAGRLDEVAGALLDLAHSLAAVRAGWGGASHAGEVTIARRRQEATVARSATGVQDRVDELASALQRTARLEQAAALGALFAAASLKADVDEGLTDEQAALTRGWKRDLLAGAELHFGRLTDLADVLVAVIGGVRVEPLQIDELRASGSFSADRLVGLAATLDELPAVYADLRQRVDAAPADAVVMEPYPSRGDGGAPSAPRPIVDQASVRALVEAITPGPGDDAGPLHEIVAALGPEPRADAAAFEPARVASPPDDGLAELLAGSYDALLATLGGGDGDGVVNPMAARRRRRDAAARLWGRVLRPLAEALARSASTAGPGDHGGGGDAVDGADVAGRVRQLARLASTVRATAPEAPPELLEAAAGLQDLAAALVDEGTAADILAECAKAQAGCPRSIQVSRNGPYLLTNVEHLESWLGAALDIRPQVALCRCGQSAAKPLCDGTHARVDFTGAKAPDRVADHRNTYRGLQVTVFDNRGTCQHSGYCTDRLPTVFRTDQEPFVAPSGGPLGEIVLAARECPSGALSYALDGHEQRDAVDHHHRRPPAVVVTKDGPYRITGAIPLADEAGQPAHRNEGASLEHYALCRCGHSQNKPFCSGMHWYVEFRDPVPAPDQVPTPFEAVGGVPALSRMARRFFERQVAGDELLAPLFADAPPDHPERVAEWLAEVLGGPARYSEARGGYANLLDRHAGAELTEHHRERWVTLLCEAARETGLATGPAVWSMFTSYVEWQSRQLVDAAGRQASAAAPQPIRWSWGPAGPPSPVLPPASEDATVVGPQEGEPLSFSAHIKPMFRPRDRQSMSFAFDLGSLDDVAQHADAIVSRLRAGTMPCDGAWPAEKVELFQRWIDAGKPA